MGTLLIQGGECINPDGSFQADIYVEEGRIKVIGKDLEVQADQTIDTHGKLVIPGGIDVHVHLPWPTGDTISLDDFDSGTRAAACGGVTTVIDFAIPLGEETLSQALDRKLLEAQAKAWVDYSFHLNVRGSIGNKLKEIPAIIKRGFPSFKVFMAYEGFRIDHRDLIDVMQVATSAGGMLNFHAEDGLLADALTRELVEKGETALSFYPKARPGGCESAAINTVLAYARYLGARIHIHHVSTSAGAELIGQSRRSGMEVTAETCPHYLLFCDEDYRAEPKKSASLVCAPPIKSRVDQEALWKALANGTLSVLATDHCPYSQVQKYSNLDDFTRVPGGIPGVETRLPLGYTTGVRGGRLTLSRFVDIWSTGPARAFGLYPRKGLIAVGSDADLTLIDPAKTSMLRASELNMNSDCLPYEGWEVYGWPVTTILRGQVIAMDGSLVSQKPEGMLIPRYLQ
jgi:dihydropyrimidinase